MSETTAVQAICIGWHTIDRLRRGEDVVVNKVALVAADDLRQPSPSASAPDGVRAAAEEIAERVNWSRDTRMSADFLEETIRKHLPAQGRPGASEAWHFWEVEESAQRVREWAQALDIPSGRFVNEDLLRAADLLDRIATPSPVEGREWQTTVQNLLDHYLACYGGNEDALALKARALLGPSPVQGR